MGSVRAFFFLFLASCLLSHGSLASNVVCNKVILAIQPSWFELGDYFTSEANQAMIDSGYMYLANLKGQVIGDQNLNMESIKALLEGSSGTFGVLEYGGHGKSNGSTGGETFYTREAAEAKMQSLYDQQKFTPGELEADENRAQTCWMIVMKPAYTSYDPSGCSVAFISTCYGTVAGNFNASCKVAGVGEADNLGLMGSFSCLMSWLVDPSYKTIKDAADKCCNTMVPIPWSFTVTSGDWQLFPFDGSAATACGFSVINGVARWRATSLWETSLFMIEGSTSLGASWQMVGTDEARVGEHAVPVSGFTYYRLLEVERDGSSVFLGLSTDGSPVSVKEPTPPSAAFLKAQIDERKRELIASRGLLKRQSFGRSMLIVTTDSLASACESGIADYWRLQGDTVRILIVDQFSAEPDVKRAQIHSAVIDSVSHGVGYVLFVGDANDHLQFDMTEQGMLWWPERWFPIHDHFIDSGWPPGGQPGNDLIPAFYLPDTLPRGQNMAYSVPYVMTLSLYADVDGDSIPDVPWGCLPFTGETEVLGYAHKLWAHWPTTSGAQAVSFYIGDRDYDDVGDGALALNDSRQLELELPPGVTVRELKVTDCPIDSERNAAAANEYMQFSGIHVIMGAFSNRYAPGDFFDKTNFLNPWNMNLVSPYQNYYPLGLWLSCSTADWARTEDPEVGLPVFHDFLAAWDRGLLACVGSPVGMWQHASLLMGKLVLQELYADPSRPMGESFLIAVRRALEAHSGDRDIALAARIYGFFGDPMACLNDLQVPTEVSDRPAPARFVLEQNYPNAFNPYTSIHYSITKSGPVQLKVFNASGQLIRTLVDRTLAPGSYTARWDGIDDRGKAVASGIYFCRLAAPAEHQTATKKMVLVR